MSLSVHLDNNQTTFFEAGDTLINLENLSDGVGYVLFVRKGKLDFWDCYIYSDLWPNRIVIKALSNFRTAIPEWLHEKLLPELWEWSAKSYTK